MNDEEVVRDVSVAMCPPAVRMLLLEAWVVRPREEGLEIGHSSRPVVALRTVQRGDGDGGDVDAVVVEDDGHLATLSELQLDSPMTAFRLLAAPWPAEEDKIRLGELAPQMCEAAVEAQARYDRKRQEESRRRPARAALVAERRVL